jgi:hypothetical protein
MKRQLSLTLTAAVVAGVVISLIACFILATTITLNLALAFIIFALVFFVALGSLFVLERVFHVFDKHARAQAEIYALQLGAGQIKQDTHALVTNYDLAKRGLNVHNFDIDNRLPRPAAGKVAVQQIEAPMLTPEQTVVRAISALDALQSLVRNSMTWCLGIDEYGRKIIVSILKSVHVLITAATGMGKTCQAANLLYQLTQANDRDYYSLYIADMKGSLLDPLAEYCEDGGQSPEDYLRIMRTLREITEDRMRRKLFNGHIIIAFFGEALAIRDRLTKEQLAQYATDLEFCAITSREYNIFLVAEMQADYSEKDFRVSKGSFSTKMNGAVLPPQARSMGFTATDLINRVASEKKCGQFLIEGPGGARIIQAPVMDLKGGDLYRLLGKPVKEVATPLRKSEEKAQTSAGAGYNYQPTGNPDFDQKARQWAEQFDQNQGGSTAAGGQSGPVVVEGTYRVLSAPPPPPAPLTELEKAAKLYNAGYKSARSLAEQMTVEGYPCGKDKALKLIDQAREQGLLND